METSGAALVEQPPRTAGAAVLVIQFVALVAAVVVAVIRLSYATWRPGPLIAIAVLAIISDLTAVET